MFGAAAALDAAQRGLTRGADRTGRLRRCHLVAFVQDGAWRHPLPAARRRPPASASRPRARAAFLRVAPHLVQPLPIVVPTYGRGMKSKPVLRAGMAAYDLLTADRNRGIDDPSRGESHWRASLGRDEMLRRYPGPRRAGLTGAGIFCDGQMYNPPRLVLAYVQSAVAAGAVCANYVEATGLVQRAGRVSGVRRARRRSAATASRSVAASCSTRPAPTPSGMLTGSLGQGLTPPDAVLARRLLHRSAAADRGRSCAHRAVAHQRPRRHGQSRRPAPLHGAMARRRPWSASGTRSIRATRPLRDRRGRARGLDRRDQPGLSRARPDARRRGAGQRRAGAVRRERPERRAT